MGGITAIWLFAYCGKEKTLTIIEKIKANKGRTKDILQSDNDAFVQFIEKCVCVDPLQRASVQQLLNDDFFKQSMVNIDKLLKENQRLKEQNDQQRQAIKQLNQKILENDDILFQYKQ